MISNRLDGTSFSPTRDDHVDKNIILVMYCRDIQLHCNRGQRRLLKDKKNSKVGLITYKNYG